MTNVMIPLPFIQGIAALAAEVARAHTRIATLR